MKICKHILMRVNVLRSIENPLEIGLIPAKSINLEDQNKECRRMENFVSKGDFRDTCVVIVARF